MVHTSTYSPRRVLIVEDHRDQALLLSRWLERAGYAPHLVASIELAKQAMRQEDYPVLLVDIEVGAEDGLAFLGWAKKRNPSLRTMILTAHPSTDRAVRALRLGADDFVEKPCPRNELVLRVQKLAARTLTPPQVVLAIGAHPDDVEIGCGGALLNRREMGDDIHILTLCRGGAGGTKAIRAIESENAARIIGATLHLKDFPDTKMSDGRDTIESIESVISEINPDVVYTHTAHDTHQDHRAVHRATLVAARSVQNIHCYQSPSSQVVFAPNMFVRIDDVFETKLRAIAEYQSQTRKCAYLAPELLSATARYWGRYSQYGLVEPFETLRSADSSRTATQNSVSTRSNSKSATANLA